MARYAYDRLSALDNSFLVLERPNAYMHVASTQIFEAGALKKDGGGIDAAAVRDLTAASLHLIPRYRQKLAWVPFENHPVWIDDDRFNLDYHIRHTALPKPGTDEQLKRLSARVMQQHLDRSAGSRIVTIDIELLISIDVVQIDSIKACYDDPFEVIVRIRRGQPIWQCFGAKDDVLPILFPKLDEECLTDANVRDRPGQRVGRVRACRRRYGHEPEVQILRESRSGRGENEHRTKWSSYGCHAISLFVGQHD